MDGLFDPDSDSSERVHTIALHAGGAEALLLAGVRDVRHLGHRAAGDGSESGLVPRARLSTACPLVALHGVGDNGAAHPRHAGEAGGAVRSGNDRHVLLECRDGALPVGWVFRPGAQPEVADVAARVRGNALCFPRACWRRASGCIEAVQSPFEPIQDPHGPNACSLDRLPYRLGGDHWHCHDIGGV